MKPSGSKLTISIGLGSARIAKTILLSVKPETKQTRGHRSATKLWSRGRVLTLQIRANDLVALRAASNSFLRFVVASLRAIEVVVPFNRMPRGSAIERRDTS
ncbi:MAG TPA: KEOPS complex subunit Pcc1 [Candidatus Bathyarchaeia archaeon]|nr:KEOPS complex subunit Pcc1 [Candidatus Bathyarchaeia archaeon]